MPATCALGGVGCLEEFLANSCHYCLSLHRDASGYMLLRHKYVGTGISDSCIIKRNLYSPAVYTHAPSLVLRATSICTHPSAASLFLTYK